MLKMPVTDILVLDLGMMGQAHCTVGLCARPNVCKVAQHYKQFRQKSYIFIQPFL